VQSTPLQECSFLKSYKDRVKKTPDDYSFPISIFKFVIADYRQKERGVEAIKLLYYYMGRKSKSDYVIHDPLYNR